MKQGAQVAEKEAVGASRDPVIAVVEDDPAVARLMAVSLQREGYAVEHFPQMESARAFLSAHDWDLVILDRTLPDGDGLDLCRELKEASYGVGRYVLILTGRDSQTEKVKSFDVGADDYVTKPFQLPELLARIRAGLRIVELQKSLLEANEQLQLLSATDPLTGLCNRRQFESDLSRAFARSSRYARSLSIVMIDVDYFKKVNDSWGHQAGDDVLREVGTLLNSVSRKVDTVCRYGGEEFVVLLPEISLLDALTFAEKVRSGVAALDVDSGGKILRITVSLGVSSYPQTPFEDGKLLMAAADRALYRAKENGRNRVELERRISARPARSAEALPVRELRA